MSKIPQLLHGNKLEHSMKFAADSNAPLTGISEGVQSLTLSSATTELSLITEDGKTKMFASILSVDPAGNRTLKLPAALDNDDLAGRTLKIVNAASDEGELITLQDSGANHLCLIGFGEMVEVLCVSQSQYVVKTDIRKHTIKLTHSEIDGLAASGVTIIPASADYMIIPLYARVVSSGTVYTGGGNVTIDVNSVSAITMAAAVFTANGTTVETAAESLAISTTALSGYNQPVSIEAAGDFGGGDAADSEATVELYFRELSA